MASIHLCIVSVALLASAAPARAGVLVVDQALGPGAGFSTIQAAVNAALDGDTILVRPGPYSAFWINGKSLSVVADGDGAILVGNLLSEPSIRVLNLAAHQEVLIRGFSASGNIQVWDCDGAIWFDEVKVTGNVACAVGGSHGAHVTRSSRVTFTRCSLRGESNSDPFFEHPSADGLRAESSRVQLFDCTLQGGWGQDARNYLSSPLAGGAGLRVEASTVTIVGCALEGGEGGLASVAFGGSICGAPHAPGGPGVELVGTASTVRSAASTAIGGVASLEPFCPGQSGPLGPAISGSGTIVALPGFARHLRANSPVRGAETLTFELGGQPGEVPLIFVSLDHEPMPLLNGSLLIGLPPTDVFVLPALPASGQASLAFPVPNVGAAIGSLSFHAQAVFLDPRPAIWLGAGTTVVLLDASL